MEKTNNNIPSAEELAIYIKEATVSVTNTYEQSPVVLMVDDSIIGTLGNFSASIGKAKSKKTFNVSAIAASALANSTVLHYRSSFPENKRTILYIDTEQGEPHCQKVLQRILYLAGLPKDADSDNLIMLGLRKYSPEMRLAIVEQAIGTIPNLGLVIIDGIRDFMYDINSPNEATNIISKFMQCGLTTVRFISTPSCIRTRMMNMPVVTLARNSTTKRKPSCRWKWIKMIKLSVVSKSFISETGSLNLSLSA